MLPFLLGSLRLATPWTKVFDGTGRPWTDFPPQTGRHLLYLALMRSAQSGTAINLQAYLQNDTTAANNHFQRALAQDNAQSFVEGTSANANQIAGATSTANAYSPVFWFFPFFKETGKQRNGWTVASLELAATQQMIEFAAQKRQGAGVVGSLTDAISRFDLDNSLSNNADGQLFRCTLA